MADSPNWATARSRSRRAQYPNTYAGGTTVVAGILNALGPDALPYSRAGDVISVTPTGTIEVSVVVKSTDEGTDEGRDGNGWTDSLDALLANRGFTGGNLAIDVPAGGPFVFSTDDLGNRTLTKMGDGILGLTGTGLYQGGVTLEGGITQLDPAAPNGGLGLAGLVITNGATLDLHGASPTVGAVALLDGRITGNPGDTLTASTYSVEEGQISVNLSGGTLTKIETDAADVVALAGTDSYTGLTTVYGGSLQLGPGPGLRRSSVGAGASSTPAASSSTTAGPPRRWSRFRRPARPGPSRAARRLPTTGPRR